MTLTGCGLLRPLPFCEVALADMARVGKRVGAVLSATPEAVCARSRGPILTGKSQKLARGSVGETRGRD